MSRRTQVLVNIVATRAAGVGTPTLFVTTSPGIEGSSVRDEGVDVSDQSPISPCGFRPERSHRARAQYPAGCGPRLRPATARKASADPADLFARRTIVTIQQGLPRGGVSQLCLGTMDFGVPAGLFRGLPRAAKSGFGRRMLKAVQLGASGLRVSHSASVP